MVPYGPSILSVREREVLALVAAGLTNRAISERLMISVGTADRHVHNILGKLGCSTRTEAAAHAHWPGVTSGRESLWRPVGTTRTGVVSLFVGRTAEIARLRDCVTETEAGRGRLTMVVGEPGIGKTRLTDEIASQAAERGFEVIWGRCYEGDWTPPYVAFAEALAMVVRTAELRELRNDLGFGGPPLARMVPLLRERLPDLPEPASLGPNEEQFRLLDAVVQLLAARAKRRPVVIVIDDLHWADAGTLSMLRHLSRFLKDHRICVIANYRDLELDRQHPLGDALVELRKEAGYERIVLRGLGDPEIAAMLAAIAAHDLDSTLVQTIVAETGGNPLFAREILMHLLEDGKLTQDGEVWSVSEATELVSDIPESVRQVIGRRLSRLDDTANRLLSTASAFNGPFRFSVVVAACGVDEPLALDAIDAALSAQLIRPAPHADTYEFTHALLAHTLYTELNPSRQVRLHRTIAEALEELPAAPPAEVAYQYHRSAALSGAEAGVPWALRAADEARAAYSWDQVVAFTRMALDLMAPDDDRVPEVTGALGHALPFVQQPEAAIDAMKLWAGTLFQRGDVEQGLDYLMLGHRALVGAGYEVEAFELARYAKPWFLGNDHRASVWFKLLIVRDEEESAPDYPGLSVAPPEKIELFRAWDALPNLDDTTIHRVWNAHLRVKGSSTVLAANLSFVGGLGHFRWRESSARPSHDMTARAERTLEGRKPGRGSMAF